MMNLTLMIGGPAGAGISSVESLLTKSLKRCGYYLFTTKEFMSRVRGGVNTVQIRITDTPVASAEWLCHIYCGLIPEAFAHAKERFSENTLLIGDGMETSCKGIWRQVAFEKESAQAAGKKFVGTYAAGVILGLLGCDQRIGAEAVEAEFSDREPEKNLAAFEAGYQRGAVLENNGNRPKLPPTRPEAKAARYMDGTTACGFGFLAGGCNFVASYPMSPSTGVLTFLAGASRTLDVLVEQAEDEIAAFNMMLGAWYAGGRGLTTTSGGGFALMGEGMSLSGMTETPGVVYLAQRPGPATGLPTRSEQGDLNLAIHAGHGEFPRIVLAPGDTDECIAMGHLAFEYADRFQVPVVVLSDQYLADSLQRTREVDFRDLQTHTHIVPTKKNYWRYTLGSPDGLSPRGVPGYGEGRVCCDSDEHDERGQITESYAVRDAMVAKRKRKLEHVRAHALIPRCATDDLHGKIAIIGWGSTKRIIEEALARIDAPEAVAVHFNWVFPLHPEQLSLLRHTKVNIVVENNCDAQFASLLRLHGIVVGESVVQHNGFNFFVDRLAARLEQRIKEMT